MLSIEDLFNYRLKPKLNFRSFVIAFFIGIFLSLVIFIGLFYEGYKEVKKYGLKKSLSNVFNFMFGLIGFFLFWWAVVYLTSMYTGG